LRKEDGWGEAGDMSCVSGKKCDYFGIKKRDRGPSLEARGYVCDKKSGNGWLS
jgi:hypothetical protein